MMKQHFAILLCALLCAVGVAAQESITTLDWEELRIDSVVPHYTEVVPLAKDFDAYTYNVRAEYMTWKSLTANEERVVRQFADEIGDSLHIAAHVGRSRGEGFLDIDFIPIIYNKEKDTYSKLMQCRIVIDSTPKPRHIARADEEERVRWAPQSVLASGRWVKIAVSESGMHAITPAQMKEMGFANPRRVKVYGYGGNMLPEKMDADTQWDDLEEIPLVRDGASGSLLFWANGPIGWDWNVTSATQTPRQCHTINPYSTRGYYFVTEGDDALTLEDAPAPTATSASRIGSFTDYVVRNVDDYAFFTGGRILWENRDLSAVGGRTFTLKTNNVYNVGDATLRISAASTDKTTLKVSFNDTSLADLTIKAPENYEEAGTTTKQYQIANANLQRGVNSIRLEANNFTLLDYFELTYPHNFTIEGNEMPFTLSQTGSVKFNITPANENQDIVLMRLGTRGTPAQSIAPTGEDLEYTLDVGKGSYVAFDRKATYRTVQIVGKVENQNLHADGYDVDMVIITPASGIFDIQAGRLAAAHAATDGVRCRVVRADKIYNEFSSGTPDATAYRRYMKMLYDRALSDGQEPPRYLLLFGDGVWDNRILTNNTRSLKADNLLLCFESVNSLSDTKSYVMEDYFGLLDDGEGKSLTSDKADIGVGRFPVRTQQEAVTMVDKVVASLNSEDAGPWQNLLLLLGDDGDDNSHMRYTDEISEIVLGVHPYMDTRKLMWDSFKRETTSTGNTFPSLTRLVNNYVAEGTLMVNYIGHGATYLLSHESVITLADVYSYTNKRQALWYTAACDIAPFDGLTDNIGEAMVLNPYGGALVFIGTTRTVYANLNRNLNNAFCRHLFAVDAKTGRRNSVGDALRLAKRDMNEEGTTVNKLHYVLLGDPSIVFGAPREKVVVERINDIDVTGEGLDGQEEVADAQLQAGAQCMMEGYVTDADGNLMDDFNGIVHARIMDNDELIICPNQSGEKTAFQYREHRKVLFESDAQVTNGRFSFSFVVPMGINYSNEKGRAVFFATGRRADGKLTTANGHTKSYIVGGTSEAQTDTEGPAVKMWLDRESFTDGAFVSAAPTLYADISDEYGLNFTASSLGQGIEVSVDDRAEWTFSAGSDFVFDTGSTTSGRLTFTLPVLTKGEHTLCMHVWDVLGNRTTSSTTFRVTDLNENDDMAVFTTTIDGSTTISVVNKLGGTPVDATVYLYDATGKLCFTGTTSGVATDERALFELPANESALASGIYFLQARLKQGNNVYQIETQKILITQ